MNRYDMLAYLEGRYIQVRSHRQLNGRVVVEHEWRKVKDGRVPGQYGPIVLAQHETGMLETLARESRGEV